MTAFHKDTLVVAAGNRPEDASSIVRMLHNPLLNRFKIVRISPPTLEEWVEWMNNRYGDDWDKRTYAFLQRFRDEGYLLQIPKTAEGLENFPTPRKAIRRVALSLDYETTRLIALEAGRGWL